MYTPEFKFALREDLKDDKRFLPTQATPNSLGFDVRAAPYDKQPIIVNHNDYIKVPLGFRCIPESGWGFELHPRSSSFIKKYMHSLIGIIDEDYSFEVFWCSHYISPNLEPLVIQFGDAIGQIIPVRRQDMSVAEICNQEFDDLCRQKNFSRTGGFGSTSK